MKNERAMREAAGLEATLARVSVRMTSSLDLAEVLAEITRGLVRELDAALARIWLVAPDDPRTLRLAASSGLSERLDGSHARVSVGDLKIGQIASTRTPVWTSESLSEDPRFGDATWIRRNGLTSFAGYPLELRGELVGVLAVFTRNVLSAHEVEWLGLFAAQASVAIHNARLFERVKALSQRLEEENRYLKDELRDAGGLAGTGIVGKSAALERVLRDLEKVAPATTTVLLRGETGTGKELFARSIHERSPRSAGPLVKVNCAALPATLVESELFGHEKGAFTGAVQRRIGRFELAHGGTLFLDEIGELPLEAQAKLLRVVQEHELERVGGTETVRVDVRIVAATNRDLAADVKGGRFRSDLYFRLAVFPIEIPPLRARREDVSALADAFLRELARRLGGPPKALDDDARAYLDAYEWPGNVRELQNVLERAVILARGERIGVADLPELASTPDAEPRETSLDEAEQPLKDRVNAYERSLVEAALRRANGNQSEAARLLRTSRATLQYKMKVLGI